MKKSVRMSDIAQKLHVSNVTVSKALAGKEGVGDELRVKIRRLAREMGYVYGPSESRAKDSRSFNVGILVPERFMGIKTSFYWVLYQNISRGLMDRNCYGIFEILRSGDEQSLAVPKMVQDRKVDGVIILGQTGREYLQKMMQLSLPVVCMDFYVDVPGIDTVITDNFYGTFLLTDHLVENGHRKIGFVGNIHATSSIQDRFLGYMKSLIANNLPYRPDWTVSDRLLSGENIDLELPEELPTAFVCNCDETAYRLVRSLAQRGLRVPDDISVVGFDNYMLSGICDPPITTVEVDVKSMAREGVSMLLKKIADPSCRAGVKPVSGRLVVKESVKKLN